MDVVYIIIVVFLFLLATFDLVVGVSNDAVNFLQPAIGSKATSFKAILFVAGIGVLSGAMLSNGMMEIARSGIFMPEHYYFNEVMIIFLAVMVTDVVLLDIFNSLGMPTSTTVSLIFELLGASFLVALTKLDPANGLGFQELLNTEKALQVIISIFMSVAIAFFFGAFVQYLTRIIFSFNYKKNMKWFIGIFGGIAVTSIIYFMLIKGLKSASFMTPEAYAWINAHTVSLILYSFVGFSLLMQILHALRINVFKVIVLLGTLALSMAFAGNDLVNFIGVPLAGFSSFQDYMANGNGEFNSFLMTSLMQPAKTPLLFLIGAGAIMMIVLMTSRKAQNVVKTSVDLARQDEGEEMFGSSTIARSLVRFSMSVANTFAQITPKPVAHWIDRRFKKDEAILENGAAFDLVRASINLVLAGLLIALGTSLKLPLSTTYVTFMVAMGTSLADRAWTRESAVFRITGVISVIGGWFVTAGAAFVLAFLVAGAMKLGGVVAMVLMIVLAVVALVSSNRRYKKRKAKEKQDEIFTKMMASKDKDEIWSLLCEHIRINQANLLKFAGKNYTQITTGFMNDDIKPLRKAVRKSRNRRDQIKVVRRKEAAGMRRVEKITLIEKNTWFHLSSNHAQHLVYCLRRMAEPCKDHVDNNFNPLSEECINEFTPIRDEILDLLSTARDLLLENQIDNLEPVKRRCRDLNKRLHTLRRRQIGRIQQSDESLKVSLVYLNVLQESQELVNSLDNMLKYTNRFIEEEVLEEDTVTDDEGEEYLLTNPKF
ncbi:phosphate transporter family protein [Porphyromonas macacae]|uniref:inorganic phosphate transporter n=1 Tax=Porphyromonas macacae TaxID=28115 RepID=UPI00052C36D6|nr:inorganic phosphate transporter [Porphyromonas macacae]KGN99560.1 phosphate transporter family protein [Porphyromonas macacae]